MREGGNWRGGGDGRGNGNEWGEWRGENAEGAGEGEGGRGEGEGEEEGGRGEGAGEEGGGRGEGAVLEPLEDGAVQYYYYISRYAIAKRAIQLPQQPHVQTTREEQLLDAGS